VKTFLGFWGLWDSCKTSRDTVAHSRTPKHEHNINNSNTSTKQDSRGLKPCRNSAKKKTTKGKPPKEHKNIASSSAQVHLLVQYWWWPHVFSLEKYFYLVAF